MWVLLWIKVKADRQKQINVRGLFDDDRVKMMNSRYSHYAGMTAKKKKQNKNQNIFHRGKAATNASEKIFISPWIIDIWYFHHNNNHALV